MTLATDPSIPGSGGGGNSVAPHQENQIGDSGIDFQLENFSNGSDDYDK